MSKDLTKNFLEFAQSHGVEVDIIDEKTPVARLKRDGKTRFVYGSLMPLNPSVSARLSKYKALTKEILNDAGFITPKGYLVTNWEEVQSLFQEKKISYPVVVKPNDEALGSDVYVNLGDEAELKHAFDIVINGRENALIEEFIPWTDHRILVVDGEIVAACKRNHPQVTGDGSKTLQDLINDYNEPRPHKPLIVDDEVLRYVRKQGVELSTVVEAGTVVLLRGNANIQTGGYVEDVTDTISPKFQDVAKRAAKELNMRLAGVDLLTADITSEESDYVITEINGSPSYDIHLEPTVGEIRDPRPQLIEAIFRDLY